ncbi:D-glycerate dehydrogenase [Rhodoferax sp.]|uniref:2-hydroxyacid dehydrogenase n=1 Tax=Rhodoferax sp. TaxID=50421 RepID=UPI0025E2585D|nr:D-glycerate dehydrogenase [Rhodoferax sp.]MCM2297055.1 D-glycerate dehydrogenase [Rhodoferax sp.]
MNTTTPSIKRPRLLMTGIPPDDVKVYTQTFFDLTIWQEATPIGAQLLDRVAGMDALVVMPGDKLDVATIAALPASVKVLGTYSVGTDHVDLKAATAKNLHVFHTPDVLTEAVADLALFLIIAAARDTSSAEKTLRDERWGRWAPSSMLGRSLQGLHLGIFGMGRIGQAVAARARPFGMSIHYHNRSELAPDQAKGASYYATLDELMACSDVLCICAPSAPELKGAINAHRLALLPQNAMLVNVARGDLMDEEALFTHMSLGRLSGIAMDVYRNEPNIDPRWLALPRTTLLPHIGSATREVRSAMGMLVVDGVASHFGLGSGGHCANPA